MLRIAALALFVAAASAAGVNVAPLATPRGPVEGVISCGSAGQMLEVRVTDCTKLPCDVTQGKEYLIEVDFIPSKSHDSFNVKATIIKNGAEYPYIDQNIPQRLQAGQAYTVTYPITVSNAFGTGLVDARIELGNGADRELCGIASCRISEAFFYKF